MTVNEDIYNLCRAREVGVYTIYEPVETQIVVGAGRKNKNDIISEKALQDGVPIQERKGGGGTVVLSRGMLVLALAAPTERVYDSLAYTRRINGWICEALEFLGISGIEHRGISDLAIAGRKILGTTLYRSRNYLFYQASLLINNDLALFTRYLTFPDTVPAYRGARSHQEFCTTLASLGYPLTFHDIYSELDAIVAARIASL